MRMMFAPRFCTRLFCHKEAREEAMYSTRVVVDIIDCLGHRNNAVRMTAEKLCDIGANNASPYVHLILIFIWVTYCVYSARV